MKLTLAEHISKSREVVAANKAKGNRHAELFATMYAQPSCFIEEILQNTEDAYSRKRTEEPGKKIRFKLFNDRIEIHHNGKDFDVADLMSLTTFANTTKKNNNEVNLIGKFGIGFKSVFSITDAPEIHCEPYHYSITDYEVLEETRQRKPDESFNSLIILPFKKKNQTDCFDSVNKGLNQLNEYSLLFLKQIACIEIFIHGELYVTIERKCNEINKTYRVISIEKTFCKSTPDKEELNFIIFSKQPQSEKQQAELAFKFIREAERIIMMPITDAPVFVYFPTRMNSRLNFILNAPFTTNPLREYITLDTSLTPENYRLINDSVVLFSKALETMRQKAWFDIRLISLLPIKVFENNEINKTNDLSIYQYFYNALVSYFKTKHAIPVSERKHALIDEVIIPHDKSIARLLNSFDLQKLYQKKYFVDSEISATPYTEVRNYFAVVLQIKTADPESFGFRILIDTGFLLNKNLEWLKNFYKYIYKNQILWDAHHSGNYYSLRNAAIILSQNHGFQAGYDAEKRLRLFMPGEKKCLLPVIHKKLLNDKDCMTFFEELGIVEPELADDIEFNIIPQFDKQTLFFGKDYIRIIEKIIEAYISTSHLRKLQIIELLKKTPWVYCMASDSSGESYFKKPSETYVCSPDIISYFENHTTASIVEPKLFKKLNKKYKGVYGLLLEETGVHKFPLINISEDNHINIDGFESFMNNITVNKSSAFIRLLLFQNSNVISPDVYRYLRIKNWIYDRNKLFNSPENIQTSDISPLYRLQDFEINRLSFLLGINESKPDSQQLYIDWHPSIQPENVSFTQNQNIEISSAINPDLVSVAGITGLSFQEQSLNKAENQIYSDEDMEKIHLWSCRFVESIIIKSVTTFIIETDEYGNRVLIKDGQISEHIFVSGKTDLINSYPLTPVQLGDICRLFSLGETTKLYLVNSAGTKNASFKIIQCPFDLLASGKLSFDGKIWISGSF